MDFNPRISAPLPLNKHSNAYMVILLSLLIYSTKSFLQVADVSWHSLEGLKDGMIRMLAETSYDGKYNPAHTYADFVGDIVGIMEWNTTMIDQWYVPVNDLHNIFIEYYGDDRGITPNLISTCTLMLLAGRIAEQELGAAIYPIEVIQAPLFLDVLQDYYLGGINDMAYWTQLVWDQSLIMATEGTENCKIVKNPMEISCNQSLPSRSLPKLGDYPYEKVKHQKEGLNARIKSHLGIESRSDFLNFAQEHIDYEVSENGIQYKVGQIYTENTEEYSENDLEPLVTFASNVPYADFGHSLHIADIDNDGNDDILVGAPGYQELGSKLLGCVFIFTSWTDFKLDLHSYDFKICQPDVGPDGYYSRLVYERYSNFAQSADK